MHDPTWSRPEMIPCSMKRGDRVLLSLREGTAFELGTKDFRLFLSTTDINYGKEEIINTHMSPCLILFFWSGWPPCVCGIKATHDVLTCNFRYCCSEIVGQVLFIYWAFPVFTPDKTGRINKSDAQKQKSCFFVFWLEANLSTIQNRTRRALTIF